jgi:hypothetical protein
MNKEMGNEKMQVGKNLTYMPVSRSIHFRMDLYNEKNSKKKMSPRSYI